MALMGLKLWQLFDLALPLIIMLIAQSILIALFASFITYKVMGKNYEAAVFASATCGFGMGATPNAIANMDELTNRFGFTPTPYFVVPLVGDSSLILSTQVSLPSLLTYSAKLKVCIDSIQTFLLFFNISI